MSDFTTVASVGGLLPTDLLARVAANDTTLPGTSADDYGLVPGERLNDHVTRSWNRLVGLWQNFQHQLQELPESERTATTLTRDRWTLPLLDELGFAGLPTAKTQQIGGKDYPISHEWDAQVPVHLPGARILIDRRTPGIPGAATTSPHGLVQEYLNRSDDRLWGIVSNGLILRLLRDNASLTRQAYVEFDLAAMFDSEAFSDFVLLWLCCHRTRFAGDPPEKCLLEQWSQEAVTSGTRALDKLRDGVETAITELGKGFVAHPANGSLRDALRSGSLPKDEFQRQLLRIVYRLLFLLVSESRDLLLDPAADATAKQRYRQYYSVDRLRRLARARRGTSHDDLWAGLTVVMQALHRDGAPSLALAPLGSFLWSPDAITNVADASIDNRHILDAVRALTLVRDDESRVHRSVDYRNLGAEELGSIYESLLELHVDVNADARTFRLDTAAGNERKTTGSYYTPTSLITELLDSALDPVLEEACKKPDPEAAILDLSMIDMAIGSGHFAIAAANRIAQRLASIRAGGVEPAPDEVRTALRDVIGRCIHGIDVNPMAVELCKISLWLEAMEPGKPLSFLDHRIVCGNALLGTTPRLLLQGIPDKAYKELDGDEPGRVSFLKAENKKQREGQLQLGITSSLADLSGPAAAAIAQIDALPDDSVDSVSAKESILSGYLSSSDAERAKLAADAWCAAFVYPKVTDGPEITTDTVRRLATDVESVDPAAVQTVRELAAEYKFFHLHLAFPHLFRPDPSSSDGRTGWTGGIDLVLGNPPWGAIEFRAEEFFADSAPDIASAGTRAKRNRMIAELEDIDPPLYHACRRAQRHAAAQTNLVKHSGLLPLSSKGGVNTYSLFTELAYLAVSELGRIGLVVQSGIVTDANTRHLFGLLTKEDALRSCLDFKNRLNIFPAVDTRQSFSLLTLGRHGDPPHLFFAAERIEDLRDEARRIVLTAEQIRAVNPITGIFPPFSSAADAALVAEIQDRVGFLKQTDTNPNGWPVKVIGFPHAGDDSDKFIEMDGQVYKPSEGLVPVYESKMIHHFDHRFADVLDVEGHTADLDRLGHGSPSRLARPRYLFRRADLDDFLDSRWSEPWLLGWRDTARNDDARTLIAALIPLSAPPRNNLPVLAVDVPVTQALALVAMLSSFAVDYVARQKVAGAHVTRGHVEQLPVPPPGDLFRDGSDSPGSFLAARALELSATAWDLACLAPSARPFRFQVERREILRAEIDAFVFHLFELNRSTTEYILSRFPTVRRREEERLGEFRSKRLILEQYDLMAHAQAAGQSFRSAVDPPPADPLLCHPESSRPEWASQERSV